ncbi:hypothetical protein [Streptomyces triculaminicus]|uniref:hypothetical protein n=1 Tax=Streptomyces triculaminicus TaxID=2816232 RepID=UPI00379EBA3A
MSLDLQAAANKRMRRGLITLAVIVAVLAVIGVLLLVSGGGKKDSAKRADPGASKPSPAATEAPSNETYTKPGHWVKLPEGADKSNGLPVKFPKTNEGAAAMTVAVVRASWSLAAADVEKSAATYVVPEEVDALKAAAGEAAAGNRKMAGIPNDGPPPQDAAFSPVPIGVQWNRQDDTHVKVTVLVRLVTSSGNGKEPETQLIVMSSMAVWNGDDWKMASVPPGKQPEPFDIGDEGFNREGWKAIEQGDKR